MRRKIYSYLQKWKESNSRKPLLIRGARQVGKSYLVKQFGKEFEYFAEVNFELMPELVKIFENDLQPQTLIPKISAAVKCRIEPGRTLLFLDEIQKSPQAVTSLRYFYELMPDLHVIAAGSLVDFIVEKIGIPVGRVRNLYMYPLSFAEFLFATDNGQLYSYIQDHDNTKNIDDIFHNRLLSILGEYFAVGGMPEAVIKWNETKNIEDVKNVHNDLIDTYKQDFSKYARQNKIDFVETVFKAVPRLCGEKFVYSKVDAGARSRDLKNAFDLLEKAGVIHSVVHSASNGLPLGAETKSSFFKAIFLDVALSQTVLGIETGDWIFNPAQTIVNKGVLAETFVGTELLAYSDYLSKKQLFYWVREKKGANAEVDYVDVFEGKIVPVEVKSGTSGHLKSIHQFLKEKGNSVEGFHFSERNFSKTDNLYSIPLYAIWKIFEKEKIPSG
ncbi:MAG TPA: AAA family ATPase [bacterium]|jgi:predicted AAA+ superfamily ATPase|nr:ATP-binding protein [bacterium]MDX9804395.1 AAA family ATPase [bacterium]HOG43575.1 AAA family ATPase [bacterium]HPV22033.1 AAA family ATPase [bacterium]HPY15406.1 AAA family ATPase [bacterium]